MWRLVLSMLLASATVARGALSTALQTNVTQARASKLKVVVIVVGTRPEVIKMAPVIHEFKRRSSEFFTVVVGTGQHKQMFDQILKTFHLSNSIDVSLDLMKENQQLVELTTAISSSMSVLLEQLKPNYVLVQGDTTTSFASAMAAFYLHIPVCHVEAGLRTWNHLSPFPEEFNRQAISSMATVHFAATDWATRNLVSEKRPTNNIFTVGNPVVDSLHMIASGKLGGRSIVLERILRIARQRGPSAGGSRLVLLTAHRRENLFGPIHNIMKAVFRLLTTHPDIVVIYPVHKNPNVRSSIRHTMPEHVFDAIVEGKLQKDDRYMHLNRMLLIDPLDYPDLLHLMVESTVILTDSGGLQEEGTSLGKPIFILRTTTERPEAVTARAALLVGTETEAVFGNATLALQGKGLFLTAKPSTVYGDGRAAGKIADVLQKRDPALDLPRPPVQAIALDGASGEGADAPCDLVVTMTVWKRGSNLDMQLSNLKLQTLLRRPSIQHTCVQVFQNGKHVDVSETVKKWSDKSAWRPYNVDVFVVQSPVVETGYYGRFLTPLTANPSPSAYFIVADDDIVWGGAYLENMIRVVDDGYLATRNGRFVTLDGVEDFIEDPEFPGKQPYSYWTKGLRITFEQDADYDFGGHTWAGRMSWLRKAWTHPPISYENCEDFWISAVMRRFQGVRTRSPRCPKGRPEQCACSHDSANTLSVAKIGKTEAQKENHNNIQRLIISTYGYDMLMKEEPGVKKRVSALYKKEKGGYDAVANPEFKECLFWA